MCEINCVEPVVNHDVCLMTAYIRWHLEPAALCLAQVRIDCVRCYSRSCPAATISMSTTNAACLAGFCGLMYFVLVIISMAFDLLIVMDIVSKTIIFWFSYRFAYGYWSMISCDISHLFYLSFLAAGTYCHFPYCWKLNLYVTKISYSHVLA